MNLSNLSAGQRIPNYKKLCELLDVPTKKGNSKNAQLKEFDRYFRYTRIGNAFLIDEIYTSPLPQHDDRQKYLYLIEPIRESVISGNLILDQHLPKNYSHRHNTLLVVLTVDDDEIFVNILVPDAA